MIALARQAVKAAGVEARRASAVCPAAHAALAAPELDAVGGRTAWSTTCPTRNLFWNELVRLGKPGASCSSWISSAPNRPSGAR